MTELKGQLKPLTEKNNAQLVPKEISEKQNASIFHYMNLKMDAKKEKRIIGRRELVDFPELGLFGIVAKIDTGAYTSALHCHDIEVKTMDGIQTLCFKLLDPSLPKYNEQEQQFTIFQEKEIKNSFGDFEKRFVIRTKIKIAKKIISTSISLTDRGNMRYPVLLGRKLLRNRFIVDVSEVNLWDKANAI